MEDLRREEQAKKIWLKHGLIALCVVAGLWGIAWYAVKKAQQEDHIKADWQFFWWFGSCASLITPFICAVLARQASILVKKGVPVWGKVVSRGLSKGVLQDMTMEYFVGTDRYTLRQSIDNSYQLGSRVVLLYNENKPSHAATAESVLDAAGAISARLMANQAEKMMKTV